MFSLLAVAGCTNTLTSNEPPQPLLRLVSYDSCERLLPVLREAARKNIHPQGGGATRAEAAPAPATAKDSLSSKTQGSDYSGTNTHTAGVDEPDLVKTDGNRIFVVRQGSLEVIDAASKRITGSVGVDMGAHQLLLQGNQVLVLSSSYSNLSPMPEADSRLTKIAPQATRVQMVNVSGTPKVVGDFRIDASLVDARQVGNLARVVVRSYPRIDYPTKVDDAPVTSWLPSYSVNGTKGQVGCERVKLPDQFSGSSIVTILSFDLGLNSLNDGDPVSVMADGGTVYGSGPNLYLAHDQSWRGRDQRGRTEIFQFDVTDRQAEYVASGSVPGYLINQYSMSEHAGILRVATTMGQIESSVHTLKREGGALNQIGEVSGLGKKERIYAVRFVGTVGYVVTFRQTDPLYTIDLRDPAKPKVLGELKIPGYSAYLHPVGADRLIGVGQDATDQGRVTGTQISLFDVGNLSDPKRIAQFKIPRGHSEAEHDPHAFLYWPATKLLVVPVNNEAVLLKVEDSQLTELNRLTHQQGYIRRSLVIGETLWTISDRGLLATTLDGGTRLAWLPL